MDYYYLVSSLPKLDTPELKAEKDADKIQSLILTQLEEEDRKDFLYLLYRNDNKNLLYILRKKKGIPEDPLFSFHRPSAFTYQELEEGISGLFLLPDYMNAFLKEISGGYEGRKTENLLTKLYFEEAIANTKDFLSDYFQYKRDIKNIIIGLNAKKFKYPLADSLLGTGRVVDAIIRSTTADLGLGKQFPCIEVFSHLIESGDFLTLEKKVDEVLLQFIDSQVPMNGFSGTAIHQYFIRLSLASRWIHLSPDKGKAELLRTVDWVVNSAALPQEFLMENVA